MSMVLKKLLKDQSTRFQAIFAQSVAKASISSLLSELVLRASNEFMERR